MSEISPLPWELVKATEYHGPFIVNAYGGDVCDLYAMSNLMAASVRNGGDSYPVEFKDAAANAEFIVKAVNSYDGAMLLLEDVPGEDLISRLIKFKDWYLDLQVQIGALKHKLEVAEAVNRLSAVRNREL